MHSIDILTYSVRKDVNLLKSPLDKFLILLYRKSLYDTQQ